MKEANIVEMQQLGLQMLKEAIRICDSNRIPYFGCFGTVLGAVRHKGYIPWDHDTDICIPIDYMDTFVNVAKKELDKQFDILAPCDSNNPVLFSRLCLKGHNSLVLHLDVYGLIGMPDEPNEQRKLLEKINKLSNLYTIKKLFNSSSKPSKSLLQTIKSKLIKFYLLFFDVKRMENKHRKLSATFPFASSKAYCIPYPPVYGDRKIWKREMFGDGLLVDFEDIKIRIPQQYDAYLSQIYGDYLQYPPEEERNEMLNKKFIIENE